MDAGERGERQMVNTRRPALASHQDKCSGEVGASVPYVRKMITLTYNQVIDKVGDLQSIYIYI